MGGLRKRRSVPVIIQIIIVARVGLILSLPFNGGRISEVKDDS